MGCGIHVRVRVREIGFKVIKSIKLVHRHIQDHVFICDIQLLGTINRKLIS
jgi:hypothetical protein